eukprot:3335006-Rhodomonas_salina.1
MRSMRLTDSIPSSTSPCNRTPRCGSELRTAHCRPREQTGRWICLTARAQVEVGARHLNLQHFNVLPQLLEPCGWHA